ncbi:MAG: hypothetical protein ACR2M3_06470 [Thermomicrobiales bacterium]
MIDLTSTSRDDLMRLIVSQRETIVRQERVIAAQQARIAVLEAMVARLTARVATLLAIVDAVRRDNEGPGSGRPRGMSGRKPAPATDSTRYRGSR